MHRSILILAWLACATLAGCAGTPTQESTGEYIDSSMLTAKVKARLATSKEVPAADISVETFKGIVQLSGFVATLDEAEKAARIAAATPGVRRVENKLTVTTNNTASTAQVQSPAIVGQTGNFQPSGN